METKPLTPRQAEVLAEVRRFLAEKGYPPSLRELAEVLGVSGTTAVDYHLERLRTKGRIERDPRVSRGIRIRCSPQS